jgi:hypothetical protein
MCLLWKYVEMKNEVSLTLIVPIVSADESRDFSREVLNSNM